MGGGWVLKMKLKLLKLSTKFKLKLKLKFGKIPLLVCIITFPVLQIIFEPFGLSGIGSNNSISCLDDSISCFENQC